MTCKYLIFASLALAACDKKATSSQASNQGSNRAGSNTGAVDEQICVYTSGKRCVTKAYLAKFPRVDAIIADDGKRLGTWKEVTVVTATNRETIKQPIDTYPDTIPALYLSADGKPAFGMFDAVALAKHGEPAFKITDIKQLHVEVATGGGRGENEDANHVAGDPLQLRLAIVAGGKETALTGDAILAIARQPGPGGDGEGWPLATLLAAAAITTPAKLRLTDAGGMNLVLEAADFADTSVPFVKLNKQGQLRFRVMKKQGDGWTRGADLRGLVKVEVL